MKRPCAAFLPHIRECICVHADCFPHPFSGMTALAPGLYRTNVYGSLFNNNVNFSISILPNFDNQHDHKIVESISDLQTALTEGGNWILQEDLTTDMVLFVTPGKELNLDLGGNTLNATKLSMTYKDGTENVSGKTCALPMMSLTSNRNQAPAYKSLPKSCKLFSIMSLSTQRIRNPRSCMEPVVVIILRRYTVHWL